MTPLTHVEAALLYWVQMHGSASYPIGKYSGHWQVGPWREWKGFPTVYETRKAAVEQFEQWIALALDRWADMKRNNPNAILTAAGIRGLEGSADA